MNIRIALSASLLLLCAPAGSAVAADNTTPAQRAQYGNDASSDSYESCARYGRCRDLGTRSGAQRWDRMAPQAPTPAVQPMMRRQVEPTPAENIVPQYRESGQIREDFANSGKPVNEPQPDEAVTPIQGTPLDDKAPLIEAPTIEAAPGTSTAPPKPEKP